MKVPVLSSLILLLGLSAQLPAIERPKSLDPDGPNERAAKSEAEEVQDQGRVDEQGPAQGEVAWLGVMSEPIDETLSVHLDVATGVVLNYVAEDSPAAAAELQRHDVITKVDGRAIASQDELRDEIQTHGPGDEVTLSVISRGQPLERKVTLGERPAALPGAPALPLPGQGLDLGGLQDHFPGLKDRMKDLEDLIPGGEKLQEQLDGHMKRLEKQLRELEKAGGGQLKMDFDLLDNFDELAVPEGKEKGGFNFNFKSSSSFKFFDDDGSVEMKTKDGSKEVVVRDKAGEILFEGPWDTPLDKASAPEEVRLRIEEMNNGNRFHFRLENLPEPEMELPDPKEPELE